MKKLGNNLGKMIKGPGHLAMSSLCHFYNNDFLMCAQQGFSVAENYVR